MVSDRVFELLEGEIRVWVDQEAVHIVAGDAVHGDPAELTASMARRLAQELNGLADEIDY